MSEELTTLQIGYEESEKEEEIIETIEMLSTDIHRIRLVKNFPQNVAEAQLENVNCAALRLSAAVMEYLAMAIKQLKSRLSG